MTSLTPAVLAALSAQRFALRPVTRGGHGEISTIAGPLSPAEILAFVAPALPARHSSWDRKGRGDQLSWDLYGWCPDEHVAVVQIRMAYRRAAKHFLGTRKDYVLCGFTEDGNPFRHPVSSAAVRGAVRAGADPAGVVRAAQRWMWGVTEQQLSMSVRQGDVLIVPHRGEPKGDLVERGTDARLAGTHVVRSSRILSGGGRLYAYAPTLSHTKAQHPDERYYLGWATVRVAQESPAWDYSVRLGD